MIDNDSLYQRFKTFRFEGYSKAIRYILSSYEIIDITINKIVDKVENGEIGPFYVYRRAAIVCDDNGKHTNCTIQEYGALPLVIILQKEQVIILNSKLGNICCKYEELYNNLDYLKPLYSWDANKNDHYKTLELDSLVESLYRTLKYEENEEYEIRDFIFSLLYITHFSSLLNIEEIFEEIECKSIENEMKLSGIFSYFINRKCPYVSRYSSTFSISKEAYKYIFAILRFDTELIDSEILTSLIYRMVNSEDAGLYGHQTSFVNIDKVLQPLFLDEMQKKAETSKNENVYQVVKCIYDTVVFDPTNSPGCFLVASYNGLLQQLREIEARFDIKCNETLDISHFVGLVENDFTANLSRLALTFACTKELKRLGKISFSEIEKVYNRLNINVGNQLTEDWSKFVSADEYTYIVGSPEFKGCNKLSASKKSNMQHIFGTNILNNADYCSAWIVKAAKFIAGTEAKAAFVLTNSISQGSQATNILNKINEFGCEYIYAYRSFKWKTSSSDNVGVTVVIIGIAAKNVVVNKYIFDSQNKIKCKEIGASLLPDIDIRITKRTNAKGPISKNLPPMRKGNMPDGAANILTFNSDTLDDFLSLYPSAQKFIKPLYGGDEFVSGIPSWCLWITKDKLEEALSIEGIKERVELVRKKRASSTSGKKSKENPYSFREQNVTSEGQISVIIPCVTSENREYFQMGILDSNAIVNNNVNVIFDCEIWVLALLESRMHMVWAKNAAGGHESRPRYSSELCYNTFPAPQIGEKEKEALSNLSKTLIEVREKYCDKSLGELYNKMPPELVRVHHWIDVTVDSLYRNQPFESDGERLTWLKNLYYKLIENE